MSKYQLAILSLYVILKLGSVLFYNMYSNDYYIRFLDVGQGDSIMLSLGDNNILIDGGPDYSCVYNMTLMHNLSWMNLCDIDAIYLTHLHEDHYKGLERVHNWCKVKYLYVFGSSDSFKIENIFNINIMKNDTKLTLLYSDDHFYYEDIKIKVVWPPKDLENSKKYNKIPLSNINNLSGILFIDMGDYEILLTGDAEKEVYDYLIYSGVVNELKMDIQDGLDLFKVPHQGSFDAHNMEFIKEVEPKNCIISVGENSYGHPSKKVVSDLEDIGCKVFRTDELGTIEFKVPK